MIYYSNLGQKDCANLIKVGDIIFNNHFMEIIVEILNRPNSLSGYYRSIAFQDSPNILDGISYHGKILMIRNKLLNRFLGF